MKIRVLGCSGAIAKGCRTTSFLIDSDILVDAGTGVGDLSLDEMVGVEHVLLTHAHLDHVAALPLMLDAVAAARTRPVCIHALAGTIEALRAHIFNDVIWPDFSQLPTPDAPFLRFQVIEVGEVLNLGGKHIEVLPAVHTVPAVGYAVRANRAHWVFTGDTAPNERLWARLNAMEVGMLVIETAFSSREAALAETSKHLSPAVLASELDHIASAQPYPIYITHTKPAETALIMSEIRQLETRAAGTKQRAHEIRWLEAGQEFEL